MRKEYAIYKKDECLFIGTIEEIMKHFHVKRETVYYWACPANIKLADTGIYPNKNRKPRKKEGSGVKVAVRLYEKRVINGRS